MLLSRACCCSQWWWNSFCIKLNWLLLAAGVVLEVTFSILFHCHKFLCSFAVHTLRKNKKLIRGNLCQTNNKLVFVIGKAKRGKLREGWEFILMNTDEIFRDKPFYYPITLCTYSMHPFTTPMSNLLTPIFNYTPIDPHS
jgi:hypothetical protein